MLVRVCLGPASELSHQGCWYRGYGDLRPQHPHRQGTGLCGCRYRHRAVVRYFAVGWRSGRAFGQPINFLLFWRARRMAKANSGPMVRRRYSGGSALLISKAKLKKGEPTLPSTFFRPSPYVPPKDSYSSMILQICSPQKSLERPLPPTCGASRSISRKHTYREISVFMADTKSSLGESSPASMI